jgi:hypothetical protein
MPMRMVGKDCWILLRRFTDKDGESKTYLFCRSEQENLPCPRDVKSGKKPYEICPSCFEGVANEKFLNDVIYPDILEPRPRSPEAPTLRDFDPSGKDIATKEKKVEQH